MADRIGYFVNDKAHGKGVYYFANADRYEGDFVEDRKEGTGTYVWGPRSPWAGQRYSGGYLKDLRNGQGVYEWPNGDRYAGTWVNDRIAGAPTRGMIARGRMYAELAAVVGREGAKVCRELEVGVGTRDIVRGTVTAVDGESISVRIDDPGKFDHMIGDRAVRKGAIITELLKFWMPCA